MKKVLLESAPEFILLCIATAILYAGVQYYRTKKQPWGKKINWLLFGLRGLLTFALCFLLLGPIVKQLKNIFEKSPFVLLIDNSISIQEVHDSTSLGNLFAHTQNLKEILDKQGYEASVVNLEGEKIESLKFDFASSDLTGALKKITNQFEGQKIGGVILVSDGIYNSGLSPLYGSFNFPIYTVGIGDTTQRMDLILKNIFYNKIAYQGNKFPIRAEVQVKNISKNDVTVTLLKNGKAIDKQTKKAQREALLTFDFQPLADQQGLQKFDLLIEQQPGEENVRNNRASAFVEVVEGRKKILLVAPAPHPDIKAIREVIEKNANYEFLLHIPGIAEQAPNLLRPQEIDLAIFYQSPDNRSRTNALFQTFMNSRSSLFVITGQQSDLRQLEKSNAPLRFENMPREFDEVTPVINPAFSNFSLSTDAATALSNYPPVFVHFATIQFPQTTTPLLFQKVGSVGTEKPLLAVNVTDNKKIAIMLGEGIWRWKMHEFERTESSASFDEIFGKLIQFLSTTEDKRKFRSYPIKQEFSDLEPVIFESQVYNDIYEPVFGNKIEILITNEDGKRFDYTYVTSPGNVRYQIGGLREGVYKYRSRTELNGKMEEVKGEFAVAEQQAERLNLTADFDLLRNLSKNTGGKFYKRSQFEQLETDISKIEGRSTIHTEESYESVINLKWVFWLLLVLVSGEWFLRKFYGSY